MTPRTGRALARAGRVLLLPALLATAALTSTSCDGNDPNGPCGPTSCPDGCCLDDRCVPATSTTCGSGGGACRDCSADPRVDRCLEGTCVCAAEGAPCPEGSACGPHGCVACLPDCAGKCADADDGCGGLCPENHCVEGCCTTDHICILEATQDAESCGSMGRPCASCTLELGADVCRDGGCVCAALGLRCPAGERCTAEGCDSCTPDCANRCRGEDDGCGGLCLDNGCAGCCTEDAVCLLPDAQDDLACGAGGERCESCAQVGLACRTDLGRCVSAWARDATFVEQTVPGRLAPGESATASVTMRNVGTAPWTEGDGFRLGSQNPQDNWTWGLGRVGLDPGETVEPGATRTFAFSIAAPASPGLHGFQWRMVQESVEWFGQHSAYVPVWVGSERVTVCEAARALAGADVDASAAVQGCLDAAAAGDAVELPAGVYRIDRQVAVRHAPVVLRTEGKDTTMAPCAPSGHDCAELRASTSFTDQGGVLLVSQPGTIVDHLVVDGARTARTATDSGRECAAGNNAYGHNIRMTCSRCALLNSVTRNSLCGTGCEVAGSLSDVVLWRNRVEGNGVHDAQGMWADGVTVHDAVGSTFSENDFLDNTDVDLIFGGCRGCVIQRNVIRHGPSFSGGAFAALMLHAWPVTSGDFTGADTSLNLIDCGPERRCGFGIYLGADAWYVTDSFGGWVHRNAVYDAEQAVALDDVHHMTVHDNFVSSPASSTNASCGSRPTDAYSIGTRSHSNDFSRETMGASYRTADWDGCIPNWWR